MSQSAVAPSAAFLLTVASNVEDGVNTFTAFDLKARLHDSYEKYFLTELISVDISRRHPTKAGRL